MFTGSIIFSFKNRNLSVYNQILHTKWELWGTNIPFYLPIPFIEKGNQLEVYEYHYVHPKNRDLYDITINYSGQRLKLINQEYNDTDKNYLWVTALNRVVFKQTLPEKLFSLNNKFQLSFKTNSGRVEFCRFQYNNQIYLLKLVEKDSYYPPRKIWVYENTNIEFTGTAIFAKNRSGKLDQKFVLTNEGEKNVEQIPYERYISRQNTDEIDEPIDEIEIEEIDETSEIKINKTDDDIITTELSFFSTGKDSDPHKDNLLLSEESPPFLFNFSEF